MKVIIVCQHCIRQYEVDSSLHGKPARCDACRAYFTINVAEPTHPGGAVNLTDPIETNFLYLHEAASCLARNMRELFDMAGHALTAAAALEFLATMPRYRSEVIDIDWRRGYCNVVMTRALYRCRSFKDRSRERILADYFIWLFPDKKREAQQVLINAFTGFLSVEFDRKPGREIAVYCKPGPLERWAARRGW